MTCRATDAAAGTAQCAFHVTVSVIPKLKGTTIVAFGDSITAGEVSPAVPTGVRYFDPSSSYPAVLQASLRARYKAQDPVVINAGLSGERVLDTGEGRIEALVFQHRPDVLTVLEGVNGLSLANVNDVSEALRRGVRRAVRQEVPLVLVSTILPGVPGRCSPICRAPDRAAVMALNDRVRAWVPAERAVLVDSFSAFDPVKELLIGEDGLHPNLEGYRTLGGLFFEAIRAQFEVPAPVALSAPTAATRSARR